ncbi:MAG: hypothetical protein ACE5IR_06665 [bacterium]
MKHTTQWTLISLFAVLAFGCSSTLKMNSQWRDREEIAIDGLRDEWDRGVIFIEKDEVSIGFSNDPDYLYVMLSTTNPVVRRQMMAMGLSLWFDADGGKDKAFGITFPIGMMQLGFMARGRGQEPGTGSMPDNVERSLSEIEIILPGEEKRRMPVTEAVGLEVQIGGIPDKLVYEIKVPLRKDDSHPFAIAARAGKAIGVGFETGKFDPQKKRERRASGGFGGGRGGRRGGFGGRGGRRGGGFGRPQMADPFKMWMSVQLGSEQGLAKVTVAEETTADTLHFDKPQSRPRRREKDGAPKVGQLAPTFKLKSLDGTTVTDLAGFRGIKPVVLFFGSYT